MLDIVLNLLSILGIVLLILLGAAFVILLLVLFFPVLYRINGEKNAEEMSVQVKADWLFGLLRIRFAYPEPGRLTVKVLFFKVFDSGDEEGAEDVPDMELSRTENKKEREDQTQAENKATPKEPLKSSEEPLESSEEPLKSFEEPKADGKEGIHNKISAKYVKIRYTIRRIYDKIKDVLENISFYRQLLTEENTRELFKHACFRVGRILKIMRPRKLKADILFGAASPDTTGRLYGAYCMLSPKFGKDIHVTPDFDQAILEGRLYVAGHITVIQLLIHGISLLLDKRLRVFLRRLKKHGDLMSKQ